MGRPKAWLPFGPDEVLLQRVVRLVREVVGPVVVVAAPGQDLPAMPGDVLVTRDPISDRGPLQGLAAGLSALPEGVEWAFATATDVPFLSPQWIMRLCERIGSKDLAIPFIDGFHHPLAALYRRDSVLPAIQNLLKDDRLRPVFLLEAVQTLVLSKDDFLDVDPQLRTLRNLNTPEDYERALADR
jgi:molybdopterin-guanine dinucleotide biosynthesis protein A